MIAKQLSLTEPEPEPIQPALPTMRYHRNSDGTITQWFFDGAERVEFKPFKPGPNWARWVAGLPLCVTFADGGFIVFRLEEEQCSI